MSHPERHFSSTCESEDQQLDSQRCSHRKNIPTLFYITPHMFVGNVSFISLITLPLLPPPINIPIPLATGICLLIHYLYSHSGVYTVHRTYTLPAKSYLNRLRKESYPPTSFAGFHYSFENKLILF